MKKIIQNLHEKQKVICLSSLFIVFALFLFVPHANAYLIGNWWNDGDNIVMDDVFLPAATWSDPAQFQMSEWNEVDTTNNSHPFRINVNPQFSFGANDGNNTIGFLGEAGLNSEYGLSYASALAWTACWTGFFSGRYDECDVMLDPTLGWSLNPHNSTWFQSTVLHELGHVRGLKHYNNFLSMQNSGTSKYLRNEILYMDDKVGVRQHASHVSERDMVIYNKWHDGSLPQWMTMSPTTLREGDTIQFNNITVENRGTLSIPSTLRFGVYLSTNDFISTSDQLLNTGTWGSFGTFTFSTFNWSATIPTVNDCSIRYIGGIIDDNKKWSERFENNNSVTFTNGVPYTGGSFTPTALTILLAQDSYEQNDSLGAARTISVPFFRSNLSIDSDNENDYYRIVLSKAGTLDIDVTFTHSRGNIDLRLLNSSGSTIASSTSTTNNESILRQVSAGTYYVRVYGVGGGSCNKYSLRINFTYPGVLSVSPDTGLSSSGNVGGPFSPSAKVYTLKNTGGQKLTYSISKTKNWVSLSKQGGSLNPNASTSVKVLINSNAKKLNAGIYDDTVTFKNKTNNTITTRTVRLTVENLPASIKILSPNGGETWPIKDVELIRWDSSGVRGLVQILLSRNGGRTYEILKKKAKNTGTSKWKVTGPATAEALIKIISLNDPKVEDTSDRVFRIGHDTSNWRITVLRPNGGEVWPLKSKQVIMWRTTGFSGGYVGILLSRDGGKNWKPITKKTPNDGVHALKVGGKPTTEALVMVYSVDAPTVRDVSDEEFTIGENTSNWRIIVKSPNGGEVWPLKSKQKITWSSVNVKGNVAIGLSRDGGTKWVTITKSTPNDGVYIVKKVSGPATEKALIRVISVDYPVVSDTSDRYFTIK